MIKELGMGGYIFATVILLIPTILRDFVYDMIASVRHRLMGTRDVCRMDSGLYHGIQRFIT